VASNWATDRGTPGHRATVIRGYLGAGRASPIRVALSFPLPSPCSITQRISRRSLRLITFSGASARARTSEQSISVTGGFLLQNALPTSHNRSRETSVDPSSSSPRDAGDADRLPQSFSARSAASVSSLFSAASFSSRAATSSTRRIPRCRFHQLSPRREYKDLDGPGCSGRRTQWRNRQFQSSAARSLCFYNVVFPCDKRAHARCAASLIDDDRPANSSLHIGTV